MCIRDRYYTGMTICYQLANGRRVRRAYTIALSDVMDAVSYTHLDVYKRQ